MQSRCCGNVWNCLRDLMRSELIDQYRCVQAAAKSVLASLGPTIQSIDTERTIALRATAMMADLGIQETWYYDCPAFVLLGSRSCASISGRDYLPSDEVVGANNLVTLDLSPMQDGIWGDCARSYCIEGGQWIPEPTIPEFVDGLTAQTRLHALLRETATVNTTFEQLYSFANAAIANAGFENLDFRGNLGHSVERQLSDRRYIAIGNSERIGSVPLFTFEPHIRRIGGQWGFKHENIYCFSPSGRIEEL